MVRSFIIFNSFLFFFSTLLLADYRDFPYSYQARTLPKNAVEFEYYIDSSLPDFDDQTEYNWRQQFEVDYGVTDKLSCALYQTFRTKSFDLGDSKDYKTTFESLKFLGKYRFFNSGGWFVDPMIYVEYIMNTSYDGKNDAIEVKEILSKDINKFHVAINLTEEYAFEGEFEFNYDGAIGFDLAPKLLLGAQVKGQFIEDFKFSLGPSLTFKAPSLFMTVGSLFGIDDKSDDLTFRVLVGINI